MNTTSQVIDELMQTLEDGAAGFTDAAEKVSASTSPEIAIVFRDMAQQRIGFQRELRAMAIGMGCDPADGGTVGAKAHRGWMAVRDFVSGESAKGVIAVAAQGEDHAIRVFTDACAQDLPDQLRLLVERQLIAVSQSHAKVKGLL